MSTKSLKVVNYSGQEFVLEDIDEFTSGYQFFYVRYLDGSTSSFNRSLIKDVIRLLPNGKEAGIFLRKVKTNKRAY